MRAPFVVSHRQFGWVLQIGTDRQCYFLLQKFQSHIFSDPRSDGLDKGNVRLAYESVSSKLDCTKLHLPYLVKMY